MPTLQLNVKVYESRRDIKYMERILGGKSCHDLDNVEIYCTERKSKKRAKKEESRVF